MKNSAKILLGVLTFLPLLLIITYIVYIFIGFIPTAIQTENSDGEVPIALFESLSVMIILIVLAIFIKLIVMVYYIIHASNNPKNESNTKIMWIVLLVLVGTIASIVYYFVEILPSKSEDEHSLGYTPKR